MGNNWNICYVFHVVGIQDSIFKWLMDAMFIEPEVILFTEGIIGLIIISILGWIESGFDLTFRSGNALTCFEVIKLTFQSGYTGLLLAGFIILTLAFNYNHLLLDKFYSPTQTIVSHITFSLIVFIYEKINNKNYNYWDWILLSIRFCITLIGCLI